MPRLDDISTPADPCVLSIGNFDGVHVGHQAIIARGRAIADAAGLPMTVLTFDPHPLVVVAPERAPRPLMRSVDREVALKRAGAARVIVAHSEPALLEKSARAFIKDVVVSTLRARHVVEGETFGFGKGREGDVNTLRTFGEAFGFGVDIVTPVAVTLPDGEERAVSSSEVRRRWAVGDVAAVRACLGRPHILVGRVVAGHGRGRSLGFATANLDCGKLMLPGEGVYAGSARVGGERWPAAISVGHTPTFGSDKLQIEAHLLDCDHDLYGAELHLAFLARLRDQKKFASADALKEQITQDVAAVRRIAAAEPVEA